MAKPRRFLSLPFFTIGALFLASNICAQPVPNSGFLYQDIRSDRLRTLPKADPELGLPDEAEPSMDLQTGGSLDVSHYVVYGNTLFSESELGEILAPFSHRTVTVVELHGAADALRARYREQGLFLAQVYIPPQAVEDGVVALHVYEGFIEEGGVELDAGEGSHVAARIVEEILTASITTGGSFSRAEAERAILLADDLPGITTHSLIYPGTEVGSARFQMATQNTARVSGNFDFDNFGSYYTGETRLGATLYFNSPSGVGDQLTFRGVTSGSGSNYVFVDYSLPVGGDGMRIGGSVDYLTYQFEEELLSADAEGDAGSLRTFVTYPLLRSRHRNLRGRAELAYLSLEDDGFDGQLMAERRLSTLTLSLDGDFEHDWLPGGTTYFFAALTGGNADIRGGESFAEFDRLNARTDGDFVRANLQFSRLQRIAGSLSGNIHLAGQWTDHNLDASQKFFIGGPFTVPGYPTGEASGDHGANVHLDLRYDLPSPFDGGALQASVFYTAGWVRLFDEPWAGWEGDNEIIGNEFVLESWGVSATQTWSSGLILRGSVGWQLGDNPGRNPVTGLPTDQSDSDYRAWVQAIYYF